MGTIISLELDGLDIVSSKNHRGPDHGALYQDADRRAIESDQVDYDYCNENGEDPTPMEMALVRKLKDVVPRLELLGFTLERARDAYDDWVVEWRGEREAIWDPGDPRVADPLSFDEFVALANRYPVGDLEGAYVEEQSDESRQGRLGGDQSLFERIPRGYDHDGMFWSERSYLGSQINILHPYLMLRVLAGNPANLESHVTWQYGPLVENGWATVDEFVPLARRRETFLIATEGTSDAHILAHAFKLLRPGIADFFRFIDVTERHPFPGTGNLLKFAEGLVKIDVQNQTVFVFDNDAEGAEAFGKLSSYSLPANMRAMVLPALEMFRAFPAKGPQGIHNADINGRAAAIECYLDHRLKDYPPPMVVWSNYKREGDTYQGALEHKESYTKAFLTLRPEKLASSGYDNANIGRILDAIVEQCVSIASSGSDQR